MTEKADPTKFEATGKPTAQQVHAVWNAMTAPSYRKVAAELEKRGFKIGFKTVARYLSKDYVQQKTSDKPKTDAGVMENAKVIGEIIESNSPKPPISAEELNSAPSELEARFKQLSGMLEADLMKVEAQKRRILNIVLMEEAITMGRVLLLAPGELAKLILAFAASTTAQMAAQTAEDIERAAKGIHPDDPRVINHVPLTPLQQSIEMFKKKDKVA